MFSKTDHVLGHKAILNEFQKIQILQEFDLWLHGIKVEI